MKPRSFFLYVTTVILIIGSVANAQRPSKGLPKAERRVYFAVVDGGESIEPIGVTVNGKFLGDDEDGKDEISDADLSVYLAPKKTYQLIFGGAPAGTVTVVKKITGECAGNSASVSISGSSAKLGGFVMALAATVSKTGTPAKSFRRLPTAAERSAIEKLVRAEFAKGGVPSAALKTLHYHNLTAIDIDNDGKAEFFGSFWAAPTKDSRSLLFFIAGGADKGYPFEYKEIQTLKADDIMSGDLNDIDTGEVLSELLLDSADIDGDGVNEIFTTTQAFEGRNFSVYKRKEQTWERVHGAYNYRCGY